MRQIAVRHLQAPIAMVWYGMVWHGLEWYGMVWYGFGWYALLEIYMVWQYPKVFKNQPNANKI